MPLSALNTEQKDAALSENSHNLVIASAGTGKTSTIVGRIATLLNRSVLPQKILLLTFTNKASNEMISRLGRYFDESITSKISAGTFHAVAYKYLREKSKIALKQPKELKILFKSLYDKRVFVNRTSTPPYSSEYLYDLYGFYINSTSSLSFGAYIQNKMSEHEIYCQIYEDVMEEFQELKKSYGYVDYNDLLTLFRDDIKKSDVALYDWVLCDEYQDTNPLQESILQALNPPGIFCVGDYDQSIYAFNGADISIISGFKDRYKDAKIYNLSKNYRSTKAIIDLANKSIAYNPRIYPKKLEVIKDGICSIPKLLTYDTLLAQYKGIASHIKSQDKNHENIAVIYRNNATADGIETTLRELNIPSKRKGGTSFFDNKEVKLMIDICSIMFNPKDVMGFINILSYGKGIGSAIAKDIYDGLQNLGNSAIDGLLHPDKSKKAYNLKSKKADLGLFEDFYSLQNVEKFNSFISSKLASHPILEHPKMDKDGAIFLDELRGVIDENMSMNNPSEIIHKIYNSKFFIKIADGLSSSRAKNKDGSINMEQKNKAKENIARKIKLLKDLSKGYTNMDRFLNTMVLGSNELTEGGGVNLLSVHASKGLEFDIVYVIDLMDGRFPNRKLMSKGGSLEEERRLFYVALTRAKDDLYLSYAKRDEHKDIAYEPSIFLYESELIQKDR